MFGKKQQLITYDSKIFKLFPGDEEPIFVRLKPTITDPEVQIEVPSNYFGYVKRSGEYSEPFPSGISSIFGDKAEFKNFKAGQTLEILFARKDKPATAEWTIEGDSSMIFRDKSTNENIKLKSVSGSFTARIGDNPTIFDRKIVGDAQVYRVDDFGRDALRMVKSAFINIFFNVIEEQNIDFVSIVRYRTQIADAVCAALNKKILDSGYLFVSFDIDKIDLDYEKVQNIQSSRNEKDEFLSDRDERIRAIQREEEERRFAHEERMAHEVFNNSNSNNITTVICPVCKKENPAGVENCVFCHSKLK